MLFCNKVKHFTFILRLNLLRLLLNYSPWEPKFMNGGAPPKKKTDPL